MPIDWSQYLKKPGDTIVLPTDWDNLFGAVQTVLGATGASQGLQDADIPEDANVPNSALANQLYYQPIVFENDQDYVSPGLAASRNGRWPATSIYMTRDAYVEKAFYHAPIAAVDLVLGVNGKCVCVENLASTSYVSQVFTLTTPFNVKRGDRLTFNAYSNAAYASNGPAVGAVLGDQVALVPIHVTLLARVRLDS